jgi:hypothetical protein
MVIIIIILLIIDTMTLGLSLSKGFDPCIMVQQNKNVIVIVVLFFWRIPSHLMALKTVIASQSTEM